MPARPALVLTALALSLTACGSSDSSDAIAVKAGDSTCEVATTSFAPGKINFAVENVGKDVTEVYVYGASSSGAFDKVVGEVENIAPGTSRDFSVSVSGGSYEVACKPGQKGAGVRTAITVSGAVASESAKYDREVEFTAGSFAFTGLSAFTAKVGEKIEFKMQNTATDHEHEFEVFGPDGKVIGEVGPTAPGAEGEVILELAVAGTYTYVCGIGDHEAKGMKGSFTVA